MKNKRIYIIFVLLIVAVIGFIILNYPPIGNDVHSDVSDFSNFNRFVRNMIKSEFVDTLPSSIPKNAKNEEYNYLYRCGLIGDPTFYIFLSFEYSDNESLYREIQRLENLRPIKSLFLDGKHYMIFDGSQESFNGYLDDEAHSGVFWHFNIVIVNEINNTIEYSLAYCHDIYGKIDRLTKTIESVINLNWNDV